MSTADEKPWKVLIVDDEPEMHLVTTMVLSGYTFKGRPLEFLSAYSSQDARAAITDNPDIAIILLDVILESERAGLALVEYIRNEIGNTRARIILRTGLPGQVPENTIILEYDINDYKSKQELTYQKLFTTITSALRAYTTIITYENNARELEKEKELLSATLRSIDDGVIVVDRQDNIALMNNVAEQFTGFTEFDALGRPFDEICILFSRKNRARVPSPTEVVLASGFPSVSSETLILSDRGGVTRSVSYTCSPAISASCCPLGAVIVMRDETRRLQMEEEIIKVQKLESIGLLAGGIAHDFNNILTGILGKISLAKLDIDNKCRSYTLIGDAENAVLRAQGLTRQLLTFSKGNAPIKEPVVVSDLITDTINIHLAGTKVLATVEIAPGTANIFADKGQISQVIGNMLVNAVQAMPSGGTISIHTENTDIPAGFSPHLDPGPFVRIEVSDTGTGISEEDIPKVFDPFFTTKRKGNGLGLTTSHMIVRRHGGMITVQSKKDEGTTFSIFIPSSQIPVKAIDTHTTHTSIGGKHVLLMDDDEIILSTIAEIIKYLGYDIDTARDGIEAVEKYRAAMSAGHRYDAVIMDLTVPGGVGGKDAIRELRALDPDVRAIVSSGYSNDPIMANYVEHGFKALIAKPYRIEDLSDILRKVIEN
jgi:PAS domain S-box-containing protein